MSVTIAAYIKNETKSLEYLASYMDPVTDLERHSSWSASSVIGVLCEVLPERMQNWREFLEDGVGSLRDLEGMVWLYQRTDPDTGYLLVELGEVHNLDSIGVCFLLEDLHKAAGCALQAYLRDPESEANVFMG